MYICVYGARRSVYYSAVALVRAKEGRKVDQRAKVATTSCAGSIHDVKAAATRAPNDHSIGRNYFGKGDQR